MKNSDQMRDLLSASARDVTSQFGEDGIIEEILRRIAGGEEKTGGWCVEFGAWDGKFLSNTYNLIKRRDFNAVLIEGDPERVDELHRNMPEERVKKVQRWVEWGGANSLDSILSESNIPVDFDFLSIDIDGCDYHIFDNLKKYRPKVVCVEYNPTIPNDVVFIQERDFSVKQGCSPLALVRLAETKGYSLVACTEPNLFFVENGYVDAVVGINRPTLDDLRDDEELKAYLFVGYDGTLLSNKNKILMRWHKFSISIKDIQYLPQFLRRYPREYSWIERWMLLGYKIYREPKKACLSLLRRLWNPERLNKQ